VVKWSRALDIRLSDWCCSVLMVWVQILSREEKNLTAQKSNSNTVWFILCSDRTCLVYSSKINTDFLYWAFISSLDYMILFYSVIQVLEIKILIYWSESNS
jgi:hypothetical protein